jgi:hypothetical protein
MRRLVFALLLLLSSVSFVSAETVRIAMFQVDATPPLGSPLCDALVEPAKSITDPLSARGIVILSDEAPIVLCAVDWIGIGNAGYDAWREALARAAGTTADRVAVHSLHQHDAPGCDFEAEELLASHGLSGAMFHVAFARKTIDSVAQAVREAAAKAQTVTHLGVGRGKVERVASNRRVLGPDGKVKYVRYSATKIPEAIAAPEGVIDPEVHLLSFWNGDKPIASLTYYATHPQSYYGQGEVSADFVGMARYLRERALPEIAHVHFNGAAGNVTAGKYNDGSKPNRPILAERLAAGMKAAWDDAQAKKSPLTGADVRWRVRGVRLPLSLRLLTDQAELQKTLADTNVKPALRVRAARDLVWARRTQAGHEIQLSALRIGPAWVVHMPGELFVEYQLAAQQMAPQSVVCMAAYGDYGPGYIGTQDAYPRGGYETGIVSRVAPEVETVLMDGLRDLLKP